jgi:hypothetical protein
MIAPVDTRAGILTTAVKYTLGCVMCHWISTGEETRGDVCGLHVHANTHARWDMRPCAECRRLATERVEVIRERERSR